jgi:hypothetical protein
MLRFEGAVVAPTLAAAWLRAAEEFIAAAPFMPGEAASMRAAAAMRAVRLIQRRAIPAAALFMAAASMPGAVVFTLAVAWWQAADAPRPAQDLWQDAMPV